MRVLILARCKNGRFAPFITEQVKEIELQGVECRYFGLDKKGILGYIRQFPGFCRVVRVFRPDVVHAHYGLCGLFANFQRRVPVVTTFHGSDINDPRVRRFSRIAIRKSRFNIFVSQKNIDTARPQDNYALIPCGINLADYPIVEKTCSRCQMSLDTAKRYVLFAGAFDNPIKNASLAKAAMEFVPEAELLELKGYTRRQVATLMQAVDVFLMTSFTEGSPQVIKEAMACGCPIVSVDVGDVRERIKGIDGCFISSREPSALATCIKNALSFNGRTQGRESIVHNGLSSDIIASRIISIYKKLV